MADDDKVVHLPTRAARGAGKSKPRKAAPKTAPRIPAARGAAAAPRHKSTTDEKALREALELQLIGLRHKHTKVDREMDVLREALKEKNEERKIIRSAVETAGMPLALFDEAYKDGKTSRVDLEKKERLRAIIREAYGLAAGPQQDFLEGLPDATKPAVYWEAEGYRCGITGLDPEALPKPPPEHIQDFERGLNSATARNGAGLKKLAKVKAENRTPIGEPKKPLQTAADAGGGLEPDPREEDDDADEAELSAKGPPGLPPLPAGEELPAEGQEAGKLVH